MDPLVGATLGKYEIQSEIGRGGMGVVYKAYDPALRRAVAIKVLPRELTFDTLFVQRFHQEAVLAARLDHPGIVQIHDVGQQDGIHYIVMQYLGGMTLEGWLASQGPLNPAQVRPLLRQVADALDYAHRHGVIHRDIKPANVMLSPEGRATLMDFGLVRAAEGTSLTRTGMVMGTPEYMSPEQALGEDADGRSDVYSLGIMLYRMLSGMVPFSRTTPYAITYAHIHEPPPPLREARADLPPAVETVVGKALAKRREDRYARAGLLADDFEAASAGRPLAAGMAPRAIRAAPDSGPTRLMTGAATSSPSKAGSPRWLPWVGVAAALLIAVVVIAALLSRRPGGTSAQTAPPAPPVVLPAEQGTATVNIPAAPATRSAEAGAVPMQKEGTPSHPAATSAPRPSSIPLTEAAVSTPPTGTPAEAAGPSFAVREGLDAVNVRSGPGTAYPKVGQLKPGQRFPLTGRNSAGDWLQFTFNDQPAWISKEFVGMSGDLSPAHVVPAPPLQGYVSLSVSGVATDNTNSGYVAPPLGVRTLSGVQFDLGGGETVTTQASTTSTNPTKVRLTIDVYGAQAVDFLLTGGNMYSRFEGRPIGAVRLEFASGASRSVDLIAGQNIREWKQGQGVVSTVSDQNVVEVWKGANKFDANPAVIDMLTVAVPEPLRNDRLVGIEILDTSAETAGDLDPAINLLGVTVLVSQGASEAQAAAVQPTSPPPPTRVPPPCSLTPGPTFARIWDRNKMGCPTGNEFGLTTAYETFERGWMLWRSDNQRHYALFSDGGQVFYAYPDESADFACQEAQALGRPRRGFSRVWCENPDVRARIGNAVDDEIGDSRPVQEFENGFMIYVKERGQIASVFKQGRWTEQP